MKTKTPFQNDFIKSMTVIPFVSFLMLGGIACNEETGKQSFPPITGDGTLTFSSEFNGLVQVTDKNGQRSLNFISGKKISTQSKMDLYNPDLLIFEYTRCTLVGIALFKETRKDIKNVLMIGLGAGSLLNFIRKYYPSASVDVIEIDPLIVQLAGKYFHVNETGLVKIHIEDGRAFLEKTSGKYDLVIIDAFNAANDIPVQLTSVEFLRHLKEHVTGNGVIVTNFINKDDGVYRSILATYAASFKYVKQFDLRAFNKGNVVIVSTDDAAKNIDKPGMIKTADAYASCLKESYDLHKYADIVEEVPVSGTNAPVIHDR